MRTYAHPRVGICWQTKKKAKFFIVLHLHSAICTASGALFVNHLRSAPSQGLLRQCRLGFEHDTLQLLPLPPYAGTQPIRPTCTPVNFYSAICIALEALLCFVSSQSSCLIHLSLSQLFKICWSRFKFVD